MKHIGLYILDFVFVANPAALVLSVVRHVMVNKQIC